MAKMTKGAKAARAQDLFSRKLQLENQTKAIYGEIDEIEGDLISMIEGAGVEGLSLGDGRVLCLSDNFTDRDGRPRNKAFKTCAISRFSIAVR